MCTCAGQHYSTTHTAPRYHCPIPTTTTIDKYNCNNKHNGIEDTATLNEAGTGVVVNAHLRTANKTQTCASAMARWPRPS